MADDVAEILEERIDGPTPAGGVYAIARYRDAVGEPIPKEFATHITIVEYDGQGNQIFRTHGTMGDREEMATL